MYTFVDLSSLVTNREGKAQRILYSVKMCNTYMSSRFTPACATRALKQRCFTLVREFFLLVPLLSKGKMLRYKLLHQCNHGKKYPNQNIENIVTFSSFTVFENHRKSLIQHCERSELRLHLDWTKVNSKCQKWSILASFWKPQACGQTVLPDRSLLIGQKLAENAKI